MRKQREIFKPVLGFEGFYTVSNFGRVWGIKRQIFLTPSKDVYGYYYLNLFRNDGKLHSYKLHRMVYEAFRGKLPQNFDIDHLDQNKANNNLNNLISILHSEHVRKHRIGFKVSKKTRKLIGKKRKAAWDRLKRSNTNN